jgi:hypothetical protein
MTPKEIIQLAIKNDLDPAQALYDYMAEKDSPMTYKWCEMMVEKYKPIEDDLLKWIEDDLLKWIEDDLLKWIDRLEDKPMTNNQIRPPFYLFGGAIYADPYGKLQIIKMDRENALFPAQRDELANFVLKSCNLTLVYNQLEQTLMDCIDNKDTPDYIRVKMMDFLKEMRQL